MNRLFQLLIYVGIWLIASGCYVLHPAFGFVIGGVLTCLISAFFFGID